MAGTVTSNLILWDSAGSTTWIDAGGTDSPNPAITIDTDVKVQGTASMSWGLKTTGATYVTTPAKTATSMVNKHLYMWLRCDQINRCATQASGGLQIVMMSGTGNRGRWYVGGVDTYGGEWKCFVLDCNSRPDYTDGTFNIAAVTHIGWGFEVITTAIKVVIGTWADAIYYGDSITVYGGTPASPATFEDLYFYSSTGSNAWGIFDKKEGVYIAKGKVNIGSASVQTYFEDNGKIVVYGSDWVSGSLYSFNITGSTTCSLGTAIGSGDGTLGVNSVLIKGGSPWHRPIRATAPDSVGGTAQGGVGHVTRSMIPPLNIDSNIYKFGSYGSIFDSIGSINFGTENRTINGNKIALVDTAFATTRPVYKNFIGTISQSLRNKLVSITGSSTFTASFSTEYPPSFPDGEKFAFKLIDTGSIDGGEFSVLNAFGFTSTGSTTTETYTVQNHDFTSDTRYLTVYLNKTWNIINPTWNTPITTQSLRFVASGSNRVNERYSYDLSLANPSGTPLTSSAVYILEGQTTDTIYATFSADTNGAVSSNILKAFYTSGSSIIVSQSYGSFVNKFYQYGYTPFAAGITVTSPIVQNITLVSDSSLVAENSSSAISAGSGIITSFYSQSITTQNPGKVIKYESGSTAFVSGSQVTGSTSGATGLVLEYIGDSSAGTLVVVKGNTTMFSQAEVLSVSGVSIASASVDYAGGGFSGSYTWVIDGNSLPMTTIYDYLAGRMGQIPITSPYDLAVLWGRSEQTQLLYVGASGYYTGRSSTRRQGVWVAKKGTGTVAYFTSDEGYQYVPPVQYSLTLTGLATGSEVRIYLTASDPYGTMGTELSGIEDSGTSFSYSYIYQADQYVDIVVHNIYYEYLRIQNVLLTSADSSIPIQQRFDRNFANP